MDKNIIVHTFKTRHEARAMCNQLGQNTSNVVDNGIGNITVAIGQRWQVNEIKSPSKITKRLGLGNYMTGKIKQLFNR